VNTNGVNINKKKMRKLLYIYIAIILVLIFSSRTIYNFSIPRVTVVMAQSGWITKELESRGVIEFYDTFDIFAISSGWINEISIRPGDLIDENTIIIQYTQTSAITEQALTDLRFNIERTENHLEMLNLNRSDIQRRLANIDYEYSTPSINEPSDELRNLEWAVTDSIVNLETLQSEFLVTSRLVAAGVLPQTDFVNAEANIAEAYLSLERARINLEEAQSTFQRSLEEAQRNLESQKRDTGNTLELELQRLDLDIDRSLIDLRANQASIATASNIETVNISTNRQGRVITVEKREGQFISQGERIATIGINNNRFMLEFSSTVSEAGFIEVGDEANVYKSGSNIGIRAVVYGIIPVGDALTFRLVIETDQFEGGEYARIRFHRQTGPHHIVVPNNAIFVDAMGQHYIWTIHSRPGSLGTEYFSTRISVRVIDSDDFNTAIYAGFMMNIPVITSYSRELSVNGRVGRMD